MQDAYVQLCDMTDNCLSSTVPFTLQGFPDNRVVSLENLKLTCFAALSGSAASKIDQMKAS